MTGIDFSILDFIQQYFRNDFLDFVMPLITKLGDLGLVWILLAVVLLVIPKTRKLGVAVTISLVLELFFCNLIFKPLVHRIRPFDARPWITPLIPKPKDFSFPSGHTGASFAAATALFLQNKKYGAIALVLAVLIGFSRLYLYVHYPSDVLGGAVIGIITGNISKVIIDKKMKSIKQR